LASWSLVRARVERESRGRDDGRRRDSKVVRIAEVAGL
jgi:hypothetical protein